MVNVKLLNSLQMPHNHRSIWWAFPVTAKLLVTSLQGYITLREKYLYTGVHQSTLGSTQPGETAATIIIKRYLYSNKKLGYRRGTARCVVSVVNCHATVQKQLVRQVLNKAKL